MKWLYCHLLAVVSATTLFAPLTSAQMSKVLSLEYAVTMAQKSDPWIEGSQHREQAIRAKSVAVGELPDPVLSIGFANLPVNDFDFGREPMSQVKIGFSQMFPRGHTLALKRQRMQQQSAGHPLLRENRSASVRVIVSLLWLEVFRNQKTLQLLEQDMGLFEHLVDVAESSYTSSAGKTRQQDLLRAQLELTSLQDRMTVLGQNKETSLSRLREWLPEEILGGVDLPDKLPKLDIAYFSKPNKGEAQYNRIDEVLLAHPRIVAIEQQIISENTGVALAKQKYKPQWGVSASYGYRDEDPLGVNRDDFFSLGVSFDLPLFTSKRQDQEVKVAQQTEAALKTEKSLAFRSMYAQYETGIARLRRLDERKLLYSNRLLKEMRAQAEASLSAYTNDTGDFAEVVRARIAELNAKIEFLNINVDRLKTIVELNYLLTPVVARSVEDGAL